MCILCSATFKSLIFDVKMRRVFIKIMKFIIHILIIKISILRNNKLEKKKRLLYINLGHLGTFGDIYLCFKNSQFKIFIFKYYEKILKFWLEFFDLKRSILEYRLLRIKQIISILELKLKWIDTFGFNCYWIPNSKNPYIQCWN